eukprot:11809537-Alexandrium_andersonii.AAC.1
MCPSSVQLRSTSRNNCSLARPSSQSWQSFSDYTAPGPLPGLTPPARSASASRVYPGVVGGSPPGE